jgi:serine/threonine protein kinase
LQLKVQNKKFKLNFFVLKNTQTNATLAADSPELTQVPMIAAEKDYAEIVEEDADYCTPTGPPPAHLQLDRQRVRLLDVIGEGQFGNVFRAEYQSPDRDQPTMVAVKTCKTESQAQLGARFLQEAHSMSQLHHSHIIELIGVCAGQPTWLLLEFATLGQLRSYLITVRPSADKLFLYAQQLCDALTYLESKRFVHRDIAARNLLVFSAECIKLADFGLSRSLHSEGCYYKAGRGKLPIKWMAPESINYRRFTFASDVWMFAVCLWEIFTHGIKPFAELKNSEVIVRLESGERLAPPPLSSCPTRLYRLMLNCWNFQPTERPTFAVLKHLLHEIGQEMNDEIQLAESLRAVSCEPKEVADLPLPIELKKAPNESLASQSRSNSPYADIDADSEDSLESSSVCDPPERAVPLNKQPSECSTSNLSVTSSASHNMPLPNASSGDVRASGSFRRDSLEPTLSNRSSFNHSLQLLPDCTRTSHDLRLSTNSESDEPNKHRSYTVPNSPASSDRIKRRENPSCRTNQSMWSERLEQQQRQSAADAKWLHEEEQQMFGSNQVLHTDDQVGHCLSYSSLNSNGSSLTACQVTKGWIL